MTENVWLVLECRVWRQAGFLLKIVQQDSPARMGKHGCVTFCQESYPDWDANSSVLYLRGTDTTQDDHDFLVLKQQVSQLCHAVAASNGRKNSVDPFALFERGQKVVRVF